MLKSKIKNRKRNKSRLYSLLTMIVITITLVITSCYMIACKVKISPTQLVEQIDNIFTDDPISIDSPCSVHFIDVAQGDSILVISDDAVILIDAGEEEEGEIVCDYLEQYDIKKIDLLIATHPHSDHIGGMDTVINRFDIGKIVMTKLPEELVPTTQCYTNLLQAIKDKKMKITPAKVGQKFIIGEGTLEILAPFEIDKEMNNNSIVTKFSYANKNFLFTGDIQKPVEKELIEKYDNLNCDVLKIAHHGSNTSSSDDFLDGVSPKFAVVSVGGINSYGNPHDKVIKRLQDREIKTYYTSAMGSVVFQLINGKFRINATGPAI